MLSSEQDSFFKANMYENFRDIGMNIKRLVDEFQQVAKSNQNIQTIGLYFLSLPFHTTKVPSAVSLLQFQMLKHIIHGNLFYDLTFGRGHG